MENNNRTIIAIVLVVLLWSGYSLFFAPRHPVSQPTAVNQEIKVEKQATMTEPATSDATAAEQPVQEKAVVPADYVERTFTVSTALYDLQLSTTGATVRSLVLKKYRESNADNSELYQLIKPTSGQLGTFRLSGSEGLPIPSDLPYQPQDHLPKTIQVDQGTKSVSFSATTPSGLTVVKNYVFHADSYRVDVTVQLINNGAQPVSGALNLALVSAWDKTKKAGRYTFIGSLTFDGEKLHEDKPADLEKAAKLYGSNIAWSGFSNKYFLMIASPVDAAAKQIQVDASEHSVQNRFVSPPITLATGQQTSFKYLSFLGPKEYDLLQAVGHHFERAIDYGMFRLLAHPLMVVLKFFNGFIGNYGVAIILLTILIKIIFWPLTQKSYKSMKGMQKLQPQMQKMREKYGSDKQRLNQEMMAFYKENRVNPLGGCLPMVIQIPVFFALYRVLLGSIELRHAPFMLWITDLSAKDPYYVTPLIMGVTMFIQQKMTPTNMDPTQAKLMMMMPVVFTFLFLNFPSGLVVYWLTNNLLTILQQYLIRRQPD